jgi:hypothetical protein
MRIADRARPGRGLLLDAAVDARWGVTFAVDDLHLPDRGRHGCG